MTIKTILRKEKSNQYTKISNTIFNDLRLNDSALGVLTYLLSRPDDWIIYKNQLQKRFGTGRDALQKTWNILKQCGYISLVHERDEKGHVVCNIWVINEQGNKNSNNLSVQLKNRPTVNPPDGETTTTNNLSSTHKEKTTTTPVVDFLDLKISDSRKAWIIETGFTKEEIETAIEKTLAFDKRTCDEAVLIDCLKNPDKWNLPVKHQQQKIIEKNKLLLEKWSINDGKKIGEWDINIGNNDITFSYGTGCYRFTIDQADFEEKVREFSNKLKGNLK